ncbi:calcium-binding protein [Aquicoccus sp. SU-CL01552]|uniref:calcium-binding protein n=1 Tax=Aquicoccus sp. SU-CL01552 TaxID=3127656 RepID=UPI003109C7CD
MVEVLNVTFDGINAVSRLPGQSDVEWSSKFMAYYSVYHSEAELFRANVSLTGDSWTVKTLRFGGEKNKTNITDLDNGSGRRIDFLELGYNSDVELISTRARYIFGWDGEKHEVKLGNQQDGSTYSINLYADENIVTTGNAYVQQINTGNFGESAIGDVIKIGSGGAGQVQTHDGSDRVTTTTGYVEAISTGNGRDIVKTNKGYVEFIHVGAGNDKVTIGAGGVETVKTGAGKDVVITNDGWVGAINTGNGNDTVKLGGGGGGQVRMGNGNDTIVLSPTDPDYGLSILGGSGTDTISFAKFGTAIVFTLDSDGAWQNPAAKNGNLEKPGKGYFQASSIENLIGSVKGDRLSGDDGKNLLNGGKGNDVLAGAEGNDTLIGGQGKDTFVFAADGGTDRVKDYDQSVDTLRIADHEGGFATLSISDKGKNLEIIHDGGTILLLGEAGTSLGAGDFDFV